MKARSSPATYVMKASHITLFLLPLLAGCTVNLHQLQNSPRARAVTTTGPWSSMIYVARTDSGVIAVDLGWIGAGGALRRALRDLDADPASVVAVFLTHSHRDHIGGWKAVRGARFHLAAAEEALLDGRAEHRDPVSRAAEWALATPVPRRGELRVLPFSRDTAFVFGADTLRAFPVPGHTDGSAAYLFRGILFMGDAISHMPARGFHGASRPYTADPARARASLASLWERIAPYRVEWVCTAHGKCARMSEELRDEVSD